MVNDTCFWLPVNTNKELTSWGDFVSSNAASTIVMVNGQLKAEALGRQSLPSRGQIVEFWHGVRLGIAHGLLAKSRSKFPATTPGATFGGRNHRLGIRLPLREPGENASDANTAGSCAIQSHGALETQHDQ